MPGKYLKSAARACAGKARFESRLDAERTSDFRHAAYQCAVCHKWHLTSKGRPQGPPPEPEGPAPEPQRPFQTVEDAVRAKVARRKQILAPAPVPSTEARGVKEVRIEARCAGGIDRTGRVLIVLEGRLVKSRKVLASLRPKMREGIRVRIAPTERGPLVLEVLG